MSAAFTRADRRTLRRWLDEGDRAALAARAAECRRSDDRALVGVSRLVLAVLCVAYAGLLLGVLLAWGLS